MSSPKETYFQELGRLLAFREQLVRDRTGKTSTLKEAQNLLQSNHTNTLETSIRYGQLFLFYQLHQLNRVQVPFFFDTQILD